MNQDQVFRKVAIDRLASPEQLDQMLQVTTPKGWVALAGLGILISSTLVWATIGVIPERISGQGMLVKTGGVLQVVAASSGRVVDVAVGGGDLVVEGQVVARIAQPDLAERLQQSKAAQQARQARHDRLLATSPRDVHLQTNYLDEQRSNIDQTIRAEEKSITWLTDKVASQQELLRKGLITRATLLETRQRVEATRLRINDARSQLTQLAAKRFDLVNRQQTEVQASALQLAEAESLVTQLTRELKGTSEVVTQYTGRVLEVMVDQGAVIEPGEPLLSLALSGRAVKELEAVLYVPSSYGKQVKVGMSIAIAPSMVKQEEHGMMLGRVTYVSDFPATATGMNRLLKNEQLVTALSRGDAPYEVRADLLPAPNSPSEYRWTSGAGPSVRIQSGTLATGYITVATRHPIAMVIPMLRRTTGL